jgi:glycosyltransferase involved in cell wall biosynthesis
VIEDGVDPELFTPHNLERFSDHNRPLVIGWAGNSAWCENKDYDPKGFKSIIMPAIESLKSEGLNIDGLFADASQGKRPRSEMPKYYNSIDLYVCASEIEGTPNPILECMSCGVPAVSSDVGVVPQVFGPLQLQFLLQERNVEAFKNAIRKIYNDRSILQGLSQENLSRIQSWSWQDKMGRWLSLFQLALSRLNSRNIARKKHLLMGANLAASDELSLRGIVIEQQKISRERNRDNSYLKSQLDDKNRLIQDLLKERETLRLARRLSQGEVF